MSADVVIRADGLGKRYVIGHRAERERYVSLRDKVAGAARRMAGAAGGVLSGRASGAGQERQDDFWALRDVSFDIRRGEVVGIIGRNGAGKSTLLKVLSRITEPSAGRVALKGRVASLLEVGTGFHPELTGRENVFLNGAILGMTQAEIRRKFDEIVAFAEVERFLDTPVKRYSSGMYVRLAFAVAAHLEPEILVVDEVLAVGDAAFQRKCLLKMSEIGGHGRTILFVSHNMHAVRQLCDRVMWLDKGRYRKEGSCDEVVDDYVTMDATTQSLRALNDAIMRLPADPPFSLHGVDVRQDGVSATELFSGKPIEITFDYDLLQDVPGFHLYFQMRDTDGAVIFDSLHNGDAEEQMPIVRKGRYVSTATIPANFLNARNYDLQIQAAIANVRALIDPPLSVTLRVHASGVVNRAYAGYQSPGKIAPLIAWHNNHLG